MSLLLRVARRPEAGALVGFCFAWFPWLLPLRRACETDRVLGFHHPRPSWATHLLLVPKLRVKRLPDLPPALLCEVVAAAALASEAVGVTDYTLCANGGPRQEVKQVHFHLFTGETYITDATGPQWEFHLQVGDVTDAEEALRRLRTAVRELELEERGYTLVAHRGAFHLLAGRRRGS